MIRYENECVGCPPNMGCIGSACRYRHVPHFFCDECGEEFDPEDLHEDEGNKMICIDCLMERHPKISV